VDAQSKHRIHRTRTKEFSITGAREVEALYINGLPREGSLCAAPENSHKPKKRFSFEMFYFCWLKTARPRNFIVEAHRMFAALVLAAAVPMYLVLCYAKTSWTFRLPGTNNPGCVECDDWPIQSSVFEVREGTHQVRQIHNRNERSTAQKPSHLPTVLH
jgi:hypothetical protein